MFFLKEYKAKKIKAPDNYKNRKRILGTNNKNLIFLLNRRFSWMKNFIDENEKGLEVGAGAGFSKYFIKNKDFLISDIQNHNHLDLKL